jgi:chromosome segregation ATPase
MQAGQKSGKAEERISVFWRVFGGTLLSIAALVCINLFQQFSNSISECRANINRLNESRGDLVKMDDFNTRISSVWNSVKEMQTANAAVSALKERSAIMEQQVKASHDQLGDRLAGLASSLKDLELANAAILALKERSALLEQQIKAGEDERKELARELQRVRERQAALESRLTVAAPGTNTKTGSPAPRH